jgi:hypothetical protein
MSGSMMNLALLLIVVVLSTCMHGQQVGEIDLGRHESDAVAVQSQNVMPEGCGLSHDMHGDGVIVSPNPNEKSKIRIEVSLPKNTFRRGETVDGNVLIKNVGADPILIPWDTDPRISVRPKDTSEHAYEMGWFELTLRDGRDLRIRLVSQSNSLYSSATPNLNPGEWAGFKLRFLIDERRTSSARRPIPTGVAYIAIEWRQARFEWKTEGCNVNTGYFSYIYQEDAKPITVKVAE